MIFIMYYSYLVCCLLKTHFGCMLDTVARNFSCSDNPVTALYMIVSEPVFLKLAPILKTVLKVKQTFFSWSANLKF